MALIKIVRTIEYIGEEDAMQQQLNLSIPLDTTRVGVRAKDGTGPVTITLTNQDVLRQSQAPILMPAQQVSRLQLAEGRMMGERLGAWMGRMRLECEQKLWERDVKNAVKKGENSV